MFCPNCGANLPDDAKFCGKCGTKLDAGEQNSAPQAAPTHVDVPVARKTRQVQVVRPAQSAEAEAEIVKPKKKLPLKLIGIIAAIVVLIAALLFVITHFVAVPSEAYIVLSDGHYELFTDLDDPEFVELASYKSDDNASSNLVRFDPTKKYVYFVTKFDRDDFTGTLCRAEWKKLKKDSSKNDQYIETIAANVSAYTSGLKFFDDGNFCYLNGEDALYYYNGEESVRVAKSVDSFYIDDKGRILYCVEDDEGDSTLYGTNVKDIDNKTKLASSVATVYDTDDFDNILYSKVTRGGEKYLYTVGFEKEAEKLLKDDINYVVWQDLMNSQSTDGADGYIIVANSGDKIDWDDYFASGTDEYTKEMVSFALSYALGASDEDELKDMYFYKNGELTLLTEGILYENTGYDGGIIYFTADNADELDLSTYDDVTEMANEVQAYMFEHMYVMVTNAETPVVCKFSADAADTIEEVAGDGKLNSMVFFNNRVYLQESEDINGSISVADIKDNEIGSFRLVSDDAFILKGLDNKVYYEEAAYSDNGSYYGDFYTHDGEEKVQIAKEASFIRLYEDGSTLVYNEDGVNILNKNGTTTWLAESAWPVRNLDGTKYLYISDEDAYVFDGKSSKMITTDAEYVWSSEYVSETGNFGL